MPPKHGHELDKQIEELSFHVKNVRYKCVIRNMFERYIEKLQ